MIKIATTIPKIAVPSASAHPSNSAFVIFPSASGCLAIASVALEVASPIPIPLMLPMNILEIFIRPLSLCMRLFGNILGAFVIMELIKIVAPLLVPVPLSLYFDLFDGFIQAYVFVFLTSLFIKETIE